MTRVCCASSKCHDDASYDRRAKREKEKARETNEPGWKAMNLDDYQPYSRALEYTRSRIQPPLLNGGMRKE